MLSALQVKGRLGEGGPAATEAEGTMWGRGALASEGKATEGGRQGCSAKLRPDTAGQ